VVQGSGPFVSSGNSEALQIVIVQLPRRERGVSRLVRETPRIRATFGCDAGGA